MHDIRLCNRVLFRLAQYANPTVPRPQGHPGLSLVDRSYRGLLPFSVGPFATDQKSCSDADSSIVRRNERWWRWIESSQDRCDTLIS